MPISTITPRGRKRSNEELDLLIAGKNGFTTNLLRLDDYSLANPEYDTVASLKSRNWRYRNGRKARVQSTLRGEQILENMYETNLPDGYDSDPEMLAITQNDCARQVFFWNRCDERFIDIRSAIFDPLKRRNTPIQSAKEDGQPLSWFTKFYGLERQHEALAYKVVTSPADPVHTVGFQFPNCPDCDAQTHQEAMYGGADGMVATTDNQFATNTLIASAIPAGHIATSHLWDGDVLYVTHADTVDPATATAGGVRKIINGVSTAVLTTAKALFAIVKGQNRLFVFGEEGLMYESLSGDVRSFSLITNTAMATTHFVSAAYDVESDQIYLAGYLTAGDGKAGRYDGNTLEDITANVGTLTGKKLWVVKVLSTIDDDYGHVAFGGDEGFVAENGDVANQTAYTITTMPTTDDVQAIEGDSWRTFFGAGAAIYHRAPYTAMEVAVLKTGLPGAIQCGATGDVYNGVNHIVFGISVSGTSGNIVILRPAVSNT